MNPVVLETARLRLDSPMLADADLVVEYCQDPLFEHYLTLPWPYRPADARFFLEKFVPRGWDTDTEYTWAVRPRSGVDAGVFLGVVGFRTGGSDVGFWLGSPHRGSGYITEAVLAVASWVFSTGVEVINWECAAGNLASASVARKTGFAYTGTSPSTLTYRDGAHPPSWHGVLRPAAMGILQDGWPDETVSAPDPVTP